MSMGLGRKWLGAALALTPLWVAAAVLPERLLPADTLGFVATPDWPGAAAALRRTAMGQLWLDPAMKAFRESYLARLRQEVTAPIEKELGVELGGYARLFGGPVALAWTPSPPDNQPGRLTSFLLVADTGTNAARLAANLALLRKNWTDAGRPVRAVRIADSDFSALTVSLGEFRKVLESILPDPDAARAGALPSQELPKTGEWTVGQVGGCLLASDSAREVEKAALLLGSNPPPSLAVSKAFVADAGSGAREAQLYGWLNVKALVGRLGPVKPPPAPEAGAENGPVLPTGALLRKLGFDAVQTVSAEARESGAGTALAVRLRIPEADRRSLLKVLSLEPKDASPPPFIAADVVKFSRARLDLVRLWSHLESMIEEISPAMAGVVKFVVNTAGKDKDEKFELRERLIARLGDDLMWCEKASPSAGAAVGEASRSLALVGVRHPEQAALGLKALAGLLPPETTRWKEREFLGRTVVSVTLPRRLEDGGWTVGKAWHYAAGPAHVALSTEPSAIDDYLRGSDWVRARLMDRAGLAEAAKQVGGFNTGFFSYENTRESARIFFETARKDALNAAAMLSAARLGSRLGLGPDVGPLSWAEFYLLPSYERVAKYFHMDVSAIAAGPDGFTYRFFAPAPPPPGK